MSATDSSLLSETLAAVRDITKLVRVNRISDYQYQEAGFGGSADIFCGIYRQKDGKVLAVAIKSIRAVHFDGQDPEYEQKMRKKLNRELEIWRYLSGASNIIELLGIITGIGPLPSPVCELCTWNLKAYLERKTPPPKHMQMMIDTLRGLSYMHELKPNPIAHGDIKSHNILVTEDEKAIICDFGRSRSPHDQPREDSKSSPFGATLRYMSPELFVASVTGPTPASDMWAFGCVGLEILCRVQPYQEVINDYEAVELIRQGRSPSDRPRGARAALVNDALWAALVSCWREQSWRPTSREFLERLMQMLQTGEVSGSPVMLDLFPLTVDGPLEPWPEELAELKKLVAIQKDGRAAESSLRSHVWRATLTSGRWRSDRHTEVVIKVPRLNVSPQHRELHDHLQHIFRKMVNNRYGVRHRNIIDILGIDSSFSPHTGLVMEHCAGGNLTTYYKTHALDTDTTTRPSSPSTNAYSLLSDILEGLKYMHNYPIPIPQGDLTPDNILITINGVAKIALFSFGRIIAAIPSAATLTASVGPILPFRWMSPELLVNNLKPTTESDMWAVGCVGFWILTGLRPYAGHLRDDFAGVDSVRGLPPGSISHIDHANTLGERVVVYRESSWITNGVWNLINKCWTTDPLLRPSANSFLSFMKSLEGRSESWMPVDVMDLAGKVKKPQSTGNRVWRGRSVWIQYESGRKMFREQMVDMVVLRTNHTPNWYSKQITVAVKQVFSYSTSLKAVDFRPYVSSIRHEIAIMAQLDHPSICKLLGMDSSHEEVPSMVFEYFSDTSLYRHLNRSKGNFQENAAITRDIASALAYIHEHPNGTIAHGNISTNEIFVNSEGRAKLTNFSCAFQYISHHSRGMTPLSSITSTALGQSRWRCPEYYKERSENYIPPPTAASDIWSFGCVIVNVFLREQPFLTKDETEYIAQLDAGVAPYSQEQKSKLDRRVLSVVQDMFAHDPTARPSAREILRRVSEIL